MSAGKSGGVILSSATGTLAHTPIYNGQPMHMQTVPINSVSHPSRKDVGIGGGLSGKEKGFSVDGVTENSVMPRSVHV